MTPLQSRLTLMVDEWGGILLCVYLWRLGEREMFWAAFAGLAIMVWGLGYSMHWKLEREWKARQERGR